MIPFTHTRAIQDREMFPFYLQSHFVDTPRLQVGLSHIVGPRPFGEIFSSFKYLPHFASRPAGKGEYSLPKKFFPSGLLAEEVVFHGNAKAFTSICPPFADLSP